MEVSKKFYKEKYQATKKKKNQTSDCPQDANLISCKNTPGERNLINSNYYIDNLSYSHNQSNVHILNHQPFNYIQTYPHFNTFSQVNYGIVNETKACQSGCYGYTENYSTDFNYGPLTVEQHHSEGLNGQLSMYSHISHQMEENYYLNNEFLYKDVIDNKTTEESIHSYGVNSQRLIQSSHGTVSSTGISCDSVTTETIHRSALSNITPSESKYLPDMFQLLQEPSHPPVTNVQHGPCTSTSRAFVTENEMNAVDTVLRQVEEKESIISKTLIKAASSGETEVLSKVVSACGIDPIKRAVDSSNGKSLLHFASENDHESTVEYLIQYVCLNTTDHRGMTPLHTAVINGRATIVEILLESGADASIKNNEGKTAYECAISLGKKRLAEKIIDSIA